MGCGNIKAPKAKVTVEYDFDQLDSGWNSSNEGTLNTPQAIQNEGLEAKFKSSLQKKPDHSKRGTCAHKQRDKSHRYVTESSPPEGSHKSKKSSAHTSSTANTSSDASTRDKQESTTRVMVHRWCKTLYNEIPTIDLHDILGEVRSHEIRRR